MITSLRGGCFSRRSNLLVVAGIASSQRTRALLAMTRGEMKSLDEESEKILKKIKGLV